MPRGPDQTAAVRETLAEADIHDRWTKVFHTQRIERFYDEQFDDIADHFRAAPNGDVLDIGCGPGHHSLRLARRGLSVTAADFSSAALEQARQAARREQLDDRVQCITADLMELPFEAGTWARVLCYGVLMHVPRLTRALDELARVMSPGAVLVISEGNMFALDDLAFAVINRLRGRKHPSVRRPCGLETYLDTPTGPLLVRHMHIPWLVRELEARGLQLKERHVGQFTEVYAYLQNGIASGAVHRANRWLRRHGPVQVSFGTLLVFESGS